MVFLAVQKFISLIGSHLFVFAFIYFASGDWTRVILESTWGPLLHLTSVGRFPRDRPQDGDLHAGSSLREVLLGATPEASKGSRMGREEAEPRSSHTPASNQPTGSSEAGGSFWDIPTFEARGPDLVLLREPVTECRLPPRRDIPFIATFIWGQFLGKNQLRSLST